MDLPATFGDYELLERIATGGMAEVFLARSFGVEGFERRVVIKRILPGLSRSAHFVSLFIREAKISALLTHPNIVQVYELGRVGEDYYIAMEHIHGRDLTRLMRRQRAEGAVLPMDLAVYVAAEIARGLAYAHSRIDARGVPLHIVHRDVSPHNVLLSFQGEVKLVDFGIARLVGNEEEEGQPGGGKFAYMSPEQATGGRVDHRSDIFSCGIVLYELLVNHRLFQDPDPQRKLQLVRDAVVPDPRLELPGLPDRLWEILQQALARDPADRYQSADQLEEDLRALLFEQGSRADEARLAASLRERFADEVGTDPDAALLMGMARQLRAMEAPPESPDTPAEPNSPARPDGRSSPLEERKRVVFLVAELIGVTDASSRIEPEELLRQEDERLRAAQRVVERFGGWLDDFNHDTLTVLFGLPRAHGDDLTRCLACAQGLSRALGRAREGGGTARIAVGVHVGEVAASGENTVRYVPLGDTLKLARRLASIAEPGQVLASAAVSAQAGEGWRFSPGPPMTRRSVPGEVDTWALVGRRARARGGPGSRWIRRGDEMERVAVALHKLAEGRGGIISLTGEAGSGKSRLVLELRELARRSGARFVVARAAPYGGDRPLSTLREIVASIAGIEEDDGPEELRDRLARLHELRLDSADLATLGALFAVELGSDAAPSREAQQTAASRLIRGLAERGGVLIAVEDIQHTTPRERELLAHMMRSSAQQRVLWLVSSRCGLPEDIPAIQAEIHLGRLGVTAQRQLLADVLGAREVAPELNALVTQQSEGNPLYLVELVAALVRSGSVNVVSRRADLVGEAPELGLPPTLEDLIAARVDSLEAADRGALRIAAAVGLRFSAALVAEAGGLTDTDATLRRLVDAGLVSPAERDGGLHSFGSELVWEVVRRSLLESQRRELHRRLAEATDRLYADHPEPHLEALAGHLFEGGLTLEAARTVRRAGDAHRRGAFLERALACYMRGVQWLSQPVEGCTRDESDALEASLRLRAGEVAVLLGAHRQAEQLLQVALDISADSADSSTEIGCYLALGRLYTANGSTELGRANVEQGLVLARTLGDINHEVALLETLGSLACDEGAYPEAEEALQEALRLAGDDDHLAAIARLGLGTRYWRAGDLERAAEQLRRAREHAKNANDPILLGRVVNNQGIVHHAAGRIHEALACFREALELRRGTGYRPGVVVNLHNIGDALMRLGDNARAFAAFQKARDAAEESGLARGVAMNDIYLGYLTGLRGEPSGMDILRQATAAATQLRDEETALTGRWLEGRLMKRQGDPEGELLLRGALERARSVGAEWIARDIEADLQ